jgi:uncharacterized protein (DUF2236 family)
MFAGAIDSVLAPVLDPVRRQIARVYLGAFKADRMPGERYDGPPGDRGLFGPDSAIWYVHADASAVVGGVCGLIWGALEPLTTHGTAAHSSYADDPLARLGRTASFVVACTYGPTSVADRMIENVRRMHRTVAGTAPDGRPYSAADPDLLAWVYGTQTEGNILAHLRYHPSPLDDADLDRYVAEYAVIARRLGAERLPETRAELHGYLEGMRPRLAVTEETRDVLRFLLGGSGDDPILKAGSALLARAGFDLMPRWARDLAAGALPALHSPTLVRLTTDAVLRTIRFGVGESPVIAAATARCAAVSAESAPAGS